MNNSTYGFGSRIVKVSTPTTDSVQLAVADEDDGSLVFGTTNAFYTGLVTQAAAGFDIKGSDLTTGYNHVGVKISTATTGNHVAVAVIRGSGRFNPPTFIGKITS